MTATDPATTARADELLRSRRFLVLLLISAVVGGLVSVAAWGFLVVVKQLQTATYTDLPHGLGLSPVPNWWPFVPLAVSGVVVALTIRYLPGRGGNVPVDGFHAGEKPTVSELPGITIAALTGIALGPVVGPEGPLIALGAGMAIALTRLIPRPLPEQSFVVIAGVGSFAAISTLLGSPIVGAFLLLEISGLAGSLASVMLLPGLLGSGLGALIFTGLGRLSGQGEFALAIPNLPSAGRPTVSEFGWALLVGVAGALLCRLIRLCAQSIRPLVERFVIPATITVALVIAALAMLYAEVSGNPTSDVLFSGQDQLPSLLEQGSTFSVGALLLLMLCKGLAYSGSLVAFRGGPTFPAMFIGAVGGIAMSHLPGMSYIPAVAIGIGAMTVSMLRLPMTSVLLTSLFLGSDGILVMPVVIVAVVVAHVTTIRMTPRPAD
jgi:H+/Cl- antiporter ClcA